MGPEDSLKTASSDLSKSTASISATSVLQKVDGKWIRLGFDNVRDIEFVTSEQDIRRVVRDLAEKALDRICPVREERKIL